MIGKCL